jgi:hypothetical protein
VSDNFFESYGEAKRAMKENRFLEVFLSTSVQTPIHVKGWVAQPNPFERQGQRWHLYLPRVEILRRLATRHRKDLPPPIERRPA